MRVLLYATLLALGTSVAAQAQPADLSARLAYGRLEHSAPCDTLNGFVENRGQWPAEVKFFATRGSIDATLLQDALVLRPQPDREKGEWLPPIVLRFPAAQAVEGHSALPTAHHFILAEGSASYVPGFERVVYREVAPGIDLVIRADADHFAYDIHVRPGAKLENLIMEVEGAERIELEGGTVLVMQTPAGRVEQRIGASWQVDEQSGATTPVASGFRVIEPFEGRMQFGFEATGRDSARAFVLDPSLIWAGYVGGVNQELLEDMHVTPDGSVYLAARSNSTGPTTPGAFLPIKPGGSNAWVGKLSPDGSMLEWATFLGGSTTEEVAGICVDADGTVVVTGDTWSTDFPVTIGSVQPTFAGQNDMFICRLTADGSGVLWSTFYGGPENDHADSLVLFSSGEVLLAGHPDAAEPPATPGAYDTVFDTGDKMLVRLSADGASIIFQTFFASGFIHGIVCDDEWGIAIGGSAGPSLPTTRGAFKESLGQGNPGDAFVAKLDPMGSQLLWATYIGGEQDSDHVNGMAVDAAGAVYVAGQTLSGDFPVTPGAFDQTSSHDLSDGFVAKLLPGGSDLVWSTYISACCGGAASIQWDIAVDAAGNAISVGSSNEPNFPTTPDAYQPLYIGGFPASDAHLTKFDAFGETLIYSTYFGGSNSDSLPSVGLDAEQDPILAMRSSSSDVPATAGVYDTSYAGSTDTVVAKFDLDLLPWRVLGGGLKGAVDTPNLAGSGQLVPGSPTRLSVRGAAPSAPASIIVGSFAANLPFKGGTMVPMPTLIVSLATNPQGALDLPFTWVNVPAGINLYAQVWVKDLGAPTGFSATNALRMTSQ